LDQVYFSLRQSTMPGSFTPDDGRFLMRGLYARLIGLSKSTIAAEMPMARRSKFVIRSRLGSQLCAAGIVRIERLEVKGPPQVSLSGGVSRRLYDFN
jgi:hypothetical protein